MSTFYAFCRTPAYQASFRNIALALIFCFASLFVLFHLFDLTHHGRIAFDEHTAVHAQWRLARLSAAATAHKSEYHCLTCEPILGANRSALPGLYTCHECAVDTSHIDAEDITPAEAHRLACDLVAAHLGRFSEFARDQFAWLILGWADFLSLPSLAVLSLALLVTGGTLWFVGARCLWLRASHAAALAVAEAKRKADDDADANAALKQVVQCSPSRTSLAFSPSGSSNGSLFGSSQQQH